MAQKIKLDLDSTDSLNFDRKVSLSRAGNTVEITFTFKHRDRLELADFFERMRPKEVPKKAPTEEPAEDPAPRETLREIVAKQVDEEAALVADFATGWNVDAPFNVENIKRLLVRYDEPFAALLREYRLGHSEARAKN